MLLLLLLFTVDAALDAAQLEKCVRGDRTAGDALLVTGRVVQPRPLRRGNITIVQPPSALWRVANAKGRRGACWNAIKATAKSQAASIKLESNAVEAQSAWEAVNARPPGASVVVQVDGGNTAAHVVAGENCSEAAKRFAKVRGLPDEAIPSIVSALEGARRSEVYSVAQVAESAEKSLLVNGSYACERASWEPDALAAFLKLSSVAVRARRTKVDARVVSGSLRALRLLQSSPLSNWALARRRAYHTFQALKKATLENDLAPSEREAARHAYERANVTGALRRRDRAEQQVALCEERLKEARKGSDAIAPAIAQHKAREEALLATLAQTRRENEEADRSVRSHLRDTVSGLCDATVKRPHLRCDNEDRKWLDEQLGTTSASRAVPSTRLQEWWKWVVSFSSLRPFVTPHAGLLGSAFLKEEPFRHKTDIAREEWEEAVSGSKTLELRFKKLPRLSRKETYAHKTLIAPFVYGKAHHVTSNATKQERDALQRALSLLQKDLSSSTTELRSKDNKVKETAKAVDALLRRAQTKAGQYISRFGIVHWASLRYDSPAHELMVLRAFEGCRVKQDDPRILRPANWTHERIELMCPPWPMLRYELKERVRELRAKFDAASDRLEHVRDTWLPAAQKVENSSTNADAGIKEGYARARLDDLAAVMSEIGATAKSVENDPLNNVSTNATINTYSAILKSDGNGSKADAFRTSAQLLMAQATDRLDADFKRAAELASLDAVVASRNTTAARRGALLADSKGYALHRPSEEKLRDLNSAESALHTAQKELDKASEVLEEALAAAAVVQVSAPALEREDIETLQQRYDDAVKEDQEANELLTALDPSNTMASIASSAKNAADQLVLSLAHRVERDAVDAVLQARKLSEQLREPGKKPSLHCPSELPARQGVEARLVEVDSVVVLPPAGPGGEARWVAHVPCSVDYEHRAWFPLAEGFAMGLAVLNGRTHVAFGESSGGSLWPGKRADFSQAEGAWLHRRVVTDVVEMGNPDLIVSLPVHVNGKEYVLDVYEGEDHRLKIAEFCKVHMGDSMCINSLTARFLSEADPDSSRREADRAAAEVEARRLEAERLEVERLDAERVEADRLEAERLEAERRERERLEAERAAAAAPKVLVSLPINVGDAEHVLEVREGEDPMAKLFEFCGKHMGTNAAACVDQLTHHVIAAGGGAEPEPEPEQPPKGVLVSLPIKVDDDREFVFTLLEGEDPLAKVQAFCQAHMAGDPSCSEQLGPVVMAQAAQAGAVPPEPETAKLLVSLPIRLDDGREFTFTLLEGEDAMQKIVAFCSASMGGDPSCIEQLKQHVTAQGGMAPEPEPARPLLSLPIRVDDGREIAFELYEGEDPMQKLKAFCQHYMGADATSCIKQMTPHVNV